MKRLMKDEYDWRTYTSDYSHQISEMERTAGDNGSEFLVTSFNKHGNRIIFTDKLHSNWKEIYTAIHVLNPGSVFECGCGGMYHLVNIRKLFPEITLGGCDLLQTQIDYGARKFKVGQDVLANVRVSDFTKPDATKDLGEYDFVYSHAVMLHLSYENTKVFMKNMTKLARKHIFFIEGQKHPYEEVLQDIGEHDSWEISHPNKFVSNSWLLTRR